jgi:hypothetical protein
VYLVLEREVSRTFMVDRLKDFSFGKSGVQKAKLHESPG